MIIQKLYDAYCDKRFGIKTGGTLNVCGDDSHPCSTISYRAVNQLINSIQFKKTDVFVDIGCGKGRIICSLAQCNLSKIVGIELDTEIYYIAKDNISKLRGSKTHIDVLNIDATDYNFNIGNYFFLFNPFGVKTLEKVLKKIEIDFLSNPHHATIIYVNPLHEEVFNSFKWLNLHEKRVKEPSKDKSKHSISIWDIDL